MSYVQDGKNLGTGVAALFATMVVAALYGAWLAVKLLGRAVIVIIGLILVML